MELRREDMTTKRYLPSPAQRDSLRPGERFNLYGREFRRWKKHTFENGGIYMEGAGSEKDFRASELVE